MGSKWRLLALGLFVIGGGVGLGVMSGVLGVPSVTTIDNTFGTVNDTTTEIETELHIQNPNPIGASLGGVTVNYSITLNEVPMASGSKSGVAVNQGNSTINLTTYLQNEQIPDWWVSHISSGERTILRVDAIVHSARLNRTLAVPDITHEITTNLLGPFNSNEPRPVNANNPFVSDPVLVVQETRASWGAVSQRETPIDMEFVVHNPNSEPVVISNIGYEITMNEITVGEGEIDETYSIPPGGTETIALTTRIQNQHLDEWWVTHLDPAVHGHQVSQFQIDFSAVIDLSAFGLGTTRVPLNQLSYSEPVRTDMFNEGLHETNTTDGTPANGAGTATPTDGTATPQDPTPTPSPTPTPTPSDGGSLPLGVVSSPDGQVTFGL